MANNKGRFDLVTKMDGNIGCILYVPPDGRYRDILWVKFPLDKQVKDNVDTMNELEQVRRRRIKKSLY